MLLHGYRFTWTDLLSINTLQFSMNQIIGIKNLKKKIPSYGSYCLEYGNLWCMQKHGKRYLLELDAHKCQGFECASSQPHHTLMNGETCVDANGPYDAPTRLIYRSQICIRPVWNMDT